MTERLQLLLGGAPKSGTTALLSYLGQHPDIVVPALREMTCFVRDEEYARGWSAALDRYFPGPRSDGAVLVGKHVMAMYSAPALDRIAQHDERLVLVLVLRNPVDRAYSDFWYARQRGWETEATFEAALARAEPSDPGIAGRGSGLAYLSLGNYTPHVERALEVLGEQRTSIVLASDLRTEPTKIAQQYFELVGVDPTFEPDNLARNKTSRSRSELAARLIYGAQFEGSPLRRTIGRLVPASAAYRARDALNRLNTGSAPIPDMDTSTRARLIEHFAPCNNALSRLIGRDLTAWHS
jgi:hypothetical protein